MQYLQKPIVRLTASFFLLTGIFIAFLVFSHIPTKAQSLPDASHPNTWHALVGAETPDHAAQAMVFLPKEMWINVGDTIVWKSGSGEPHTITFLQSGQQRPALNPLDPLQNSKQGSGHYDGTSYYNSGIMATLTVPDLPAGVVTYTSYQLTFDVTGDFTFICLLHPMMGQGTIHVRPAGTSYPYSQLDYDKQAAKQAGTLLLDAYNLAQQAKSESTNLSVTDGIGDSQVGIMRFFPHDITVHVNDTITFTNRDADHPHTVTFGTLTQPNFIPTGNPVAFDGTIPLNSGYIFPNKTYSVTFVKAGTYAFICDLHDYLGMLATITVLP